MPKMNPDYKALVQKVFCTQEPHCKAGLRELSSKGVHLHNLGKFRPRLPG